MILNLMLGRRRGGLEQAAIDYAEALVYAHIPALTVMTAGAWIAPHLVAAGLAHERLRNVGYWDVLAARRLRKLAQKTQARAVICHGNRALGLGLRALHGHVPVIAVAHNYKTQWFAQADHCFAITEHLRGHLNAIGAKQVTRMPNMVRLPVATPRPDYRTPPAIGTMGRFLHKKGFDVYLEALAMLKSRGVKFRAVLGGEGQEQIAFQAQITAHGLEKQVTLLPWIMDKASFFDSIDLFVLPSREEAFGIVLIEAMAYRVPVITSDAEGPREITHHGIDALVTPRGDATALADALAELIANPARARALGDAGHALVAKEYTLQAMAARLQQALAPYGVTHAGA